MTRAGDSGIHEQPTSTTATAVVLADRRCSAVTKAGKPCPTRPLIGHDVCRMHLAQRDAGLAERVQAERRMGGHMSKLQYSLPDAERPDYSSPEGVRKLLEDTTHALMRGQLAPSIANSIANLANVGLRLAELAVDARIAALELKLAEAKTRERPPVVFEIAGAAEVVEAE